MSSDTLYGRLGGYDAIVSVVDDLLARLKADAQLGRFWQHRGEDGVLRERQLLINFLCSSAGGSLMYVGRDMKTAHKGMGIECAESGSYAYGGWPDIDELYRKQLAETDHAKREAMLHQIQKTLHERTRFAPIYDFFWPSGIGPRVEEASLMKIDPFPWSAPLEDVRLKRP